MDGNTYKQKVNKLRKLAARGEAGLFVATCLLFAFVFLNTLWRYIKRPVFRTVASMGICLIFICETSFDFLSHSSGMINFDSLYLDYSVEVEANSDTFIEADEVFSHEEASADAETAGLEDLLLNEENNAETGDEHTPAHSEQVFDKNEWSLMLVNKTHSIPEDYTFTLGTIKGSMKCDERIITPLTTMFKAASKDGVSLIVCSPYRDLALQERLFERKMNLYRSKGYSYIEAYRSASAIVTVPGTSEHQLGLALDIVCDTYSTLDAGFGETKAGKWLKNNAYKYGFTLRYPKDKEDITGIIYEPWHYRYVGIDAATYMYEHDMCLEEFVETL